MGQKAAESYCYSAFGEKKIYSGDEEIEISRLGNPWGYLSKRADGVVATNLRLISN